VTAKSSIRIGVCFINPAPTRETFCVLPWEICRLSRKELRAAVRGDLRGHVSRISRLFLREWWSRCHATQVVVGPRRDLGRLGKRPFYTPSDTGTGGARLRQVTGVDGTSCPVG